MDLGEHTVISTENLVRVLDFKKKYKGGKAQRNLLNEHLQEGNITGTSFQSTAIVNSSIGGSMSDWDECSEMSTETKNILWSFGRCRSRNRVIQFPVSNYICNVCEIEYKRGYSFGGHPDIHEFVMDALPHAQSIRKLLTLWSMVARQTT
jgi:hypothetical protein